MIAYTNLQAFARLKSYSQKYGLFLFLFILAVLCIGLFWQQRQQEQEIRLVKAANIYENLLTELAKHNINQAQVFTKQLQQYYTRTSYASLAALQLAKHAAQQNNLAEAEGYLTWALQQKTEDKLFLAIIRIRLAKVLLAEKQPVRVLDILNDQIDTLFKPIAIELKGDAFVQLHQPKNALKAYLTAQDLFLQQGVRPAPLGLKIKAIRQG